MASTAELEDALKNAHAAGDTAAATQLADALYASKQTAPTPLKNPDTTLTMGEKVASALPDFVKNAVGYLEPSARRFVQGAAAPIAGTVQLGTKALGGNIDELVKQKQAANVDGVNWMGMAGSLASPANMLLKGIPVAANVGGRAAQGAGIGTLFGLAQPTTSDNQTEERLGSGAAGAAIGGAMPSLWELAKLTGKAVRNVTAPMTEEGLRGAVGRMANTNAGPERDKIIALLENAKANVPGSPITAGQASVPANRAEFAAFQELAKNANPSLYAGSGVEGAQEAARTAALGSFGKDKAALNSALALRSSQGAKDYGLAYQQAVKVDPALAQIMADPYVKKALPTALDLAKSNNVNPKTDLTQFLQYVKSGLDKQISKTGEGALHDTEKRAATGAKNELLSWLDAKNIPFKEARNNFLVNSVEPNQMSIGQYLSGKLNSPLDTGERAGVFAQAMRDAPATIKNSVGSPVYKDLNQVLYPQNMRASEQVLADLQNNAAYKELARSGMTAAAKNIGVSLPEVPSAGMFSPKISVTRAALNRIIGKEHGKILESAGKEMLDPATFAQIMRDAKPYERQLILDHLLRYGAATAPGASK